MSIYLVEIDGYNPATAAVDTLRYATRAYTSRPTDTPANARYLPRLATALNLEQSMYSQGTTGGASEVGVGAVELANTDGALDGLLDFGFAGRAVRVYSIAGAKSSLASRTLVFRGTVEQPEFSLERVTFRVRDRLAELDKPVATARYRGDNDPSNEVMGIEGSSDIAGQVKPVCIGQCRNVSLVCVNPQKLVYQTHDGPVAAIEEVYDSGALLGAFIVNGDFGNADLGWIYCPGTSYDATNQHGAYAGSTSHGAGVIRQIIQLSEGATFRLRCDYHYQAKPDGRAHFEIYQYGGTTDATLLPIFSVYGPDYGTPNTIDGSVDVTFVACDGTDLRFAMSGGGDQSGGWVDNIQLANITEDYPDIASLESAIIPAGSYATCLAEGLIRLGASPAGEVTADVLGAIAGPNLVANGFFDDASAWTPAGGWAIDPDRHKAVKAPGSFDFLSQPLPTMRDVSYRVRFIVHDYAGGWVQVYVGGRLGTAMSANGVYTATVMADNASGLQIRGSADFGGSVTAVSVRRMFLGGDGPASRHVPANILWLLAMGYGGKTESDLDEDSFTELLLLDLPFVGHLVADDATTIIAAMDAIAGSVGAWWTIAPDGRLRVGRLALPSGTPRAELTLNSESLESGGIERLATGDAGSGVPVWKVNVAYQRNWTVQTSSLSTDQVFAQSNVAGVVDDTRRAWLNAEYRTAGAEGAAILVAYPAASEMRVETGLDTAAEAQVEATRLLALFGTRRDRFKIRVPAAKACGLGLGDVIRVTFPRFGLAAGKLFTVIGRTDVLSGDQDTTDLDIWG